MTVGGQVTREASIYLAGFLGAAVLQFLAVPVYTRYLGPAEYAQFAITQALTASLAGLLVLGGDVALARFWFDARSDEERHNLAVSWIGFLTAWSVVVVLIFASFAAPLSAWLNPGTDLTPLLLVGLGTLVPAQLSRMLAQVLRNEFRPVPFAITTVMIGALSMVLGLAFAVVVGLGPLGILIGALIAEVLVCLVRLPLVRGELRGKPSWQALRPPLTFGIPLVPASLAMWVFTGADRIAIGRYMGEADLGAYSVAAVLVAPFSVLLTALGQAWIPRVSQLYEISEKRATLATGQAIEMSLIGFGMAAAGLGALAAPLIQAFSGDEYGAGAVALPILALGAVFLGTSLFTQTGSMLVKQTKLLPVITVLAALVNIVLLVLLVPVLGMVGASIAVCAGYLILALGTLAYSQHYMTVPVRWWRVGLICALICAQAIVATVLPGTSTMWESTILVLAVLAALGVASARAVR